MKGRRFSFRTYFPAPERSEEYLRDRAIANAVGVQFATLFALAIDTITFTIRLFLTPGEPRTLATSISIFATVALVCIGFFVRSQIDSKLGRTTPHGFHALFWVIVVAAGSAGWATMIDNIEGFASFAGAVLGTAALFRAHWRFFAGIFAAALSFMIVFTLATYGGQEVAATIAYGLIWSTVALVLAAKLETDQQRLFRTNQELAEKNRALEYLSFRDPLTGLFNRRYLVQTLEQEITIARRYGKELSVGLIDVDFFKRVNDELGHPAGDSVLQEVSILLQNAVRESDILARYGGEEFLVIFIGCGIDEAKTSAERVRSAVESHRFEGVPWSMTISIGVTQLQPAECEPELLKRADELLYTAKRNGRNLAVAA